MKRLLSAAIACAVATCLYWIAVQNDGRELPTATNARAQASAETPEPKLSTAEPIPSSALESEASRQPAAPQRAALDHAPALEAVMAIPENQRKLLIQVVDKRNGKSVPSAEIYWVYPSDVSQTELALFGVDLASIDPLFERYGRRLVADEHGQVRMDQPASEVFLLGRSKGLWALEPLHFDSQGSMLFELGADPVATALVLNSQAQPQAGVPVCLRVYANGEAQDSLVTLSDERGIARLEHFQFALGTEAHPEIYLAIPSPLGALLEAKLDSQDLERQVQLQLPEAGGVDVLVVDQEGNLIQDELILRTQWLDPERSSREHKSRVRNGRARVFPVALGLTLSLTAHTLQDSRSTPLEVPGPLVAGEWIEVRLQAPRPRLLHGQLLLADGEPARQLSVGLQGRWQLQRFSASGAAERFAKEHSNSIRSDAAGRFVAELPAELQEFEILGGELEFIARPIPAEAGQATLTLTAEARLGPQDRLSKLDIGVVQLQSPALLLSGRVQDLQGAPIGAAKLRLRGASQAYDFAEALSARDGSFAIHGVAGRMKAGQSEDYLELEAQHAEYATRTLQAPQGSSELLVEMQRASGLKGSLLLGELEASGIESIELKASPGGARAAEEGSSYWRSLDRQASFSFEGLMPGRFELSAHLEHSGESIPILEGIELVEGQELVLRPMRLPPAVSTIRLLVRGDQGQQGEFELHIKQASGGWKRSAVGSFDQALTIGTSRGALDLMLYASGYGSQLLEGASGSIELMLNARATCRLVLHPSLPALMGNEVLIIQMQAVEGPIQQTAILYSKQANRGDCLINLPHDGSYSTTIHLQVWTKEGVLLESTEVGDGSLLHYAEKNGLIELRLSQEKLEAARAARKR